MAMTVAEFHKWMGTIVIILGMSASFAGWQIVQNYSMNNRLTEMTTQMIKLSILQEQIESRNSILFKQWADFIHDHESRLRELERPHR